MKCYRWVITFAAAMLFVSVAQGEDWMRFRGPGGLGASEQTGLPVKWSTNENIVWKMELPGPGTSSPVVVGNKIYVTCYSGYALSQLEPGDQSKLMRHVVSLDRKTGTILWKKDFKPQLEESTYGAGNNGWHGYSSSTPASDGNHLYVFFGKSGVHCLDLDGEQQWHASVGSRTSGWGSCNSVALFDNLVIINAAMESNMMYGLDKASGKKVWEARVGGARNTPILVEVSSNKTELVLSLPEAIVGYDPKTGNELWRCEGIPDRSYVCPSLIAHDGIVYAIGGRKNTAIAVKAGGRGNVTELWRTDKGANVSSPVYHDGHLYWFHERRGIAYCLDAKTGETIFEERINPRPQNVYSSAIVADGKIYNISQHNGAYVLAAKPEFEMLAHNTFEDDNSRTNACIVVSNGQLLLRNDRNLYCIGQK